MCLSFQSDVWALGCCVYEMSTLKHAFNAKDMNSLVYRIVQGKVNNVLYIIYTVYIYVCIYILYTAGVSNMFARNLFTFLPNQMHRHAHKMIMCQSAVN